MPDHLTISVPPPGNQTPAEPALPVPDLAALLALCPESVVVFDRDFRITYANPHAIRVSHLGPDGSLGKNYWDLRPDARGSTLEKNFLGAMQLREARRFEYFYPRFDLWVDVQVFPHGDGLAVFYQDVTAVKHAEQSRDSAAKQLQQLYASSPDAILIVDRDWNFTFANPLAMELLQSGPLVGENLWTFFPGALEEPFQSNYRRTMESRLPTEFEAFYPAPLRRWYRISVRPFADSGITLFFSDITARRATEERRDELVKRLDQVYATTPDSILIFDADWNFNFANPQAVELLHSGQLVGENLWTIFPGNLEEPYFSNYQRTMTERVPTEFEAFYPDPLNMWFRVLARPYGEDSLIVFFRDITATKLVEQQRDRNAAQLEQVFNVTTDAVISLDRNYNLTSLNRRASELLSPAGDLLGQNLWECFPDAVYPGSPFQEHYALAMEQRIPTDFEAFYPAPLNLWLRIEARPSAEGITLFFRDITADRAATAALRASENRYRILTELNPQLIFTSNPKGQITFANQSLLDFIGLPQPEPGQQSSWLSAIHPDDRDTVADRWVQALKFGTKYTGVARICHRSDGQYRWLDMTALPIRDNDGVIQSWLGVASDIHEQKSASEALAASESRYRILTDLNPQFIWMGAPDGKISYANQRFLEYIGPQHTPDDTGNWINAFDPADRDRVIRVWIHSVKTGTDYDLEARLLRNEDGASRWFRMRASPVRDDSGNILHWLGVAIDMHESRTFAEELHKKQLETERQRAELESIYENTPVGLALFDPVTFRYLRINDELAKSIGLPKEQILGRSILEIASGVATIGELFRQVATGKPVRDYILEGELSTQPGVNRTWNVNYFPVYDRLGNITGITTASLEITQQRKTEAALVQSEKLAAVGRLASSISHEINNPLEAITNILYLLGLSPDLPEDLQNYVNMAQAELSRVSQIATQTLRFHRQAVKPTSVTAAQLVDAVLNLYQGRLTNSGIRVEPHYSTSTEILCFENDIRQVLNNLIANAIDAMRGGGRLLVRAHETTDLPTGRRGVRITIADTGHGMSAKTLSRLYEPFYTTKDLNGTGLGLWISHGIVNRHKGRLHVRSTQHPVHHGTIFTLFLPCVPD